MADSGAGGFGCIAIVNRGEPAMRLINAVREWNRERDERLRTVALYTDPDRDALFVREADEAFPLGPAFFLDPRDTDETGSARRKSRYFDYDTLREAFARTGADAAWAGWGFVSEQPDFVDLCRECGVVFIGPPAEAMRRVGDKIAAKLLAEKAGVPVAPWSGGAVADAEAARAHAARIGFPLMVKATAGGGGRGIRIVPDQSRLDEALASASAEAHKAFGDGTVFLEALVTGARHIEVQIIADRHGAVWAAGVRDCSAQRGHQKILEEAPSPALTEEQDAAIRLDAVRIASAAGYENAGTVEFLFDPGSGRRFFMEVNARLQVEHPVTEVTTGLDMVKLQIAVARGERLDGEPPRTRGHAIEARFCAEDPDRGFAPSPGRLIRFRPGLGPGVRIDAGVQEGDVIPSEFDSMIAKFVAWGATREEARARLVRALLDTLAVVEGGATNRAFLLRLLSHPDFASSRIDVGWVDRPAGAGEADAGPDADVALLAGAIVLHERCVAEEEMNFFASATRGRPSPPGARRRRAVELRYRGREYRFRIATPAPGLYRVRIDGADIEVRWERTDEHRARLVIPCAGEMPALRRAIVAVPAGHDLCVEVDGRAHRIGLDPGGLVRSPAPAIVLGVHVAEGAEVRAGDRLLSLEAMKMEMPLTAPFDGRRLTPLPSSRSVLPMSRW